jgi:hypothetical protein
MQPKRPFLPELNALRHYPKAGPEWRSRHLGLAKAHGKLIHPALKLRASGERLRLIRSPGPDLTVTRPSDEIGIGLFVLDQLDYTLDTRLPV